MPNPTQAAEALQKKIFDLVAKHHSNKIKFKNFYAMHGGIGALSGGAIGAGSGAAKEYFDEQSAPVEDEAERHNRYKKQMLSGALKGSAVGLLGGLWSGRSIMNKARTDASEKGSKAILDKLNELHLTDMAQVKGNSRARQALEEHVMAKVPKQQQGEWIKSLEETPGLGMDTLHSERKRVLDTDTYKAKAFADMEPDLIKAYEKPSTVDAFGSSKEGCDKMAQLSQLVSAKLTHIKIEKAAADFDQMLKDTQKRQQAEGTVLYKALKTSSTPPSVTKAFSLASPLDARKKEYSHKALQGLPKLAGAPLATAVQPTSTPPPPVDPKLNISPEARGQGPRIMNRLMNEPGKVLPQVKQNFANGAKMELGSAAPATQSLVNGATRAATSLGLTGPVVNMLKAEKDPRKIYPYLEANWGKGKPLEGVQNGGAPVNPALPQDVQPIAPRQSVQGLV